MLSILIVNWNTRDLLRACLDSLHGYLRGEYEIIVVDNASDDNSAQMVRDEFPQSQLIASPTNTGYAAGNNLAYQKSHGEWVWLLNPDTEIDETSFSQLLDFITENPRCGAVASCLVDAQDGSTQHSCRAFPEPAALWFEALGLAAKYPHSKQFGFYRMSWWNYNETRQVDQPMASSLLLRREAIESSGGLFDEDFPIYFNDVDLCWRLHENDWEIWYVPQSKVRHHGGASTSQRRPEMIRESHQSLERFYEKQYRKKLNPLIYYLTISLIRLSGWWRVKRALCAV
ncbi:MAG: glycosyltransferase family 2 protein [Abditibacteriaceae bacterium]